MTIDKLFENFKTEMQVKGYCLQTVQDKEGTRLMYEIPQQLWIDLRIQAPRGKEPTTQVFTKINPDLIKHVGEFYKQARAAATKIGQQITFTEPTSPNEGMLVIYLTLK